MRLFPLLLKEAVYAFGLMLLGGILMLLFVAPQIQSFESLVKQWKEGELSDEQVETLYGSSILHNIKDQVQGLYFGYPYAP
jgi:hypothetical protein